MLSIVELRRSSRNEKAPGVPQGSYKVEGAYFFA